MSRLETILASFQCRRLSAAGVRETIVEPDVTAVFFAGRDGKYDEADDVAVALRELIRSRPDIARAVAVAKADEAELMNAWAVTTGPTILFARAGRILGQIPRIKSWAVYVAKTDDILSGPKVMEAAHVA